MEQTAITIETTSDREKLAIYQDPNCVTLYRYENPNIPYDESREGVTSIAEAIGNWYTDNTDDLLSYAISRVKGTPGGRFITIRVSKDDLPGFDATLNPETSQMDIEQGNYVVPQEIAEKTSLIFEAPFEEHWQGRQDIPVQDWNVFREFIASELSESAIVDSLSANN